MFVFNISVIDAEECWTQLVNSLSVLPGVGVPGAANQKTFVEQLMTGEMTTESVPLIGMHRAYSHWHERLKCKEAPEEMLTTLTEKITKVSCYVSKETNYLYEGIMNVLLPSRPSPIADLYTFLRAWIK